MIIIKYKQLTASFNTEQGVWRSDNRGFSGILNNHVPDSIDNVSSIYYKGKSKVDGRDGIALDALSFLGADLKLIHSEKVPLPELEGNTVV